MAFLRVCILVCVCGSMMAFLLDNEETIDVPTDDVVEDLTFVPVATSENILFTADKIRIRKCDNEIIGWCSEVNDTDPAMHVAFTAARVIQSLTLESTSVSCSRVQASSGMERFELQYLDSIAELKTYATNISGPLLGDGGRIIYVLNPTIYTRMLRITPSKPGSCFALTVRGSDGTGLCSNVTCKNGGKCSGVNQCSCPRGYIGETCETIVTLESIQTNSFEFLNLTNGTIFTPDADFDVIGNVTLQGANQRRFLHIGNAFRCLFHGATSAIHQLIGHGHHHPWSIFNHCNPYHGFSHSLHVSFGHHHDHHHHSYLFHYSPHLLPGLTASCFYTNGHLHYGVHHNHNWYNLVAAFKPRPNHHHHVTLSYAYPHGISLYVNGALLGSQTKPSSIATSGTLPPHPGICIGICGLPGTSPIQMTVSNVVSAGLHWAGLALNGLSNLISPSGNNALATTASHKQPATTSTRKPTTNTQQPTKTSTKQLSKTSTQQSIFTKAPATATHAHQPATTAPNGPLCYSCSQQATDGACKAISRCKSSDVCALYKDVNGYTHKCLDAQVCNQAKQLTGATCWNCCSGSLCNDRCQAAVKPPCVDKPTCSVLQSTGFYVCSKPILAAAHCRKSCHIC